MHNTLDLFYDFLSRHLINFFIENSIRAGDRYFLFFEKKLDVQNLYSTLIKTQLANVGPFQFKYNKDAKEYNSHFIEINNVRLIIATDEEVTDSFLTTLRNCVSAQVIDSFKGTAIIILYSGKLDSLLGGSSDLTKAGMPFNYNDFTLTITNLIKASDVFTKQERSLLEISLNKIKKETNYDQGSVFDLASLIKILQREKFQLDDYASLGLFPHQELNSIPDHGLLDVINENQKWFEQIEFAIRYGDLKVDLDKRLSSYGIDQISKELSNDDWQKIDFSDIQKWEIKNNDKTISFQKVSCIPRSKAISIWDRPDGETMAKKRNRNIIIFNSNGTYPLTITLDFDATLKGELSVLNGEITPFLDGKRLKLTILQPAFNDEFLHIIYKDAIKSSSTFTFKIWIVNLAASLFEGIEAIYNIQKTGDLLLTTEDYLVFNRSNSQVNHHNLVSNDQIDLRSDQCLKLGINHHDEGYFPFTLHYKEDIFKLLTQQLFQLPNTIRGWEVWQTKREFKNSFQYELNAERNRLKLLFKNQEYLVRDTFRQSLIVEIELMKCQALAWLEEEDHSLSIIDLRLSESMRDAYFTFYKAIQQEGTLPSLLFFDDELTKIAYNYVSIFLQEVNDIQENTVLDEFAKADLFIIGTVMENFGSRTVKFSPLHPLVVAYQLEINKQLQQTNLYEAILQKLTPLNLVPIIFWKSSESSHKPILYVSKENTHSPEWMYFSPDTHFKQSSGRQFIRGLVKTKLDEFVSNFGFLFSYDQRTPIKLSVFYMGDCLQVLQGLFDYFKAKVNEGLSPQELRPIDVYIYGSDYFVTAFEQMAQMTDLDELEQTFNISVQSKRYDFEGLVQAFRSKIHFYNLDHQHGSNYTHLSFYEFSNDSIEETYRNSTYIPSGLSLDGLLSDVPSYYDNQTYVTGFGTKFIRLENDLTQIAKAYNSLAKYSFSRDPFQRGNTICTTLTSSIKSKLEFLYTHSQWVTFVDPHFDLSFFKEDDDLIIIHYSDQYSNASGFDAITVTKKSNQYQFLLQEFLSEKGIQGANHHIPALIDLFNAINGEWLLRLIGRKDENYKREKLSLLAAVKYFLAFYDHPEVIWVPISLEEILRISGGAGLNQSEALFSAKNLGAKEQHCDDLLFIGLYEVKGVLQLELYPIEVKIGQNNSDVLSKARRQGERTQALLYKHLKDIEQPFLAKFYRNFFAKLAIMNAGKMKLYNAWPQKNWARVTEHFRNRLLNDEFEIAERLSSIIGGYGVIAFTQGTIKREYQLEDTGVMLTLFEEDAYTSLVKPIDEIKHWLYKEANSIDTTLLLSAQVTAFETIFNGVEESAFFSDLPAEIATEVQDSQVIDVKIELNTTGKTTTQVASRDIRILFGEDINNRQPVYWYPTDTSKVMHTNTGIIGTMGTGKTQFTKSLITQLARESIYNVDLAPIGILIFDYKGDYIKEDFTEVTGAQVYNLHHLPYNPLAIDVGTNAKPLLPLHIASTLQETISTAFNLGNKQSSLLREFIMAAYEEKNILKNESSTWGFTAPTIADVCNRYFSSKSVPIDSLYAVLNQLYEYEIFEPSGSKARSLFDLVRGVTVINLSGYSSELQNLVVAITLDAFYSQMQKQGHSKIKGDFRQLTKIVLVDEADNFLSKNFTSLKKILKEGREFGVGTILSTQFLDHFSTSENDFSQYILTWIVHRVNEVKGKEVEALFSIVDKEQKERITQMIKKLNKHQSLVNLAGSKPLLIEDHAFWKLLSDGNV